MKIVKHITVLGTLGSNPLWFWRKQKPSAEEPTKDGAQVAGSRIFEAEMVIELLYGCQV